MSVKVTPDKLGLEIDAIMKDYSDEVWEEVQKISVDVANDAAKKLRNTSPRSKGPSGGEYAKGWKVKTTKGRLKVSSIVYNAKKPQLTHLLEFGHIIAGTGRRGGQREHIAKVEQWANEEYEKRLKEAIER